MILDKLTVGQHICDEILIIERRKLDLRDDPVGALLLNRVRTDFKKKRLPPHSVGKRRFGLTLQDWLDRNHPTGKTPLDELPAQAARNFIRECLRIQPVSAEDYNARRTHPSRGWYAVARYNHTRRWRILPEKLKLPGYNNRGTPDSPPQLKVRVISDYNFEE